MLSRHEEKQLNFQVTCQIMSIADDVETLSIVESGSAETSSNLSASAALSKKRIQLENSLPDDASSLVPWAKVELTMNGREGRTFARIAGGEEGTFNQLDKI